MLLQLDVLPHSGLQIHAAFAFAAQNYSAETVFSGCLRMFVWWVPGMFFGWVFLWVCCVRFTVKNMRRDTDERDGI